jgi:hypothetical protein
MQTTIQLSRKFPTAKLAHWEIQFLPNCGWKAVQAGNDYFLQFRCESAKALRVLGYLRGEYKTVKFEQVPDTPEVQP